MHAVLDQYDDFARQLTTNLEQAGIDVAAFPLSHVAVRAENAEQYTAIRDSLAPRTQAIVENNWKGRMIAKILLEPPLRSTTVQPCPLVELIAPPHGPSVRPGPEHIGFVVGWHVDRFAEQHHAVITGQQHHGPFCRPYIITFNDGLSAKFYRYSLRDVVELEGRRFVPVA